MFYAVLTIIWIIVVISIVPYLTDKNEHTTLYKIKNNVYIKTSRIIGYIVMILYYSHTTPARAHRRNVIGGGGE